MNELSLQLIFNCKLIELRKNSVNEYEWNSSSSKKQLMTKRKKFSRKFCRRRFTPRKPVWSHRRVRRHRVGVDGKHLKRSGFSGTDHSRFGFQVAKRFSKEAVSNIKLVNLVPLVQRLFCLRPSAQDQGINRVVVIVLFQLYRLSTSSALSTELQRHQ